MTQIDSLIQNLENAPTVETMEDINEDSRTLSRLANILADIAFKMKGANIALTLDVLETHANINDGKRSYTDEGISDLKQFLDHQGMNGRVQKLLEDIVSVLRGGDLQPFFEWDLLYHELMRESFEVCPRLEE
jgi:hypothetical protein